mgnify:CR=1 FL=1
MIPAMFVIGAISQYVGASLGVGLFEQLSPVAVAWLRGAGAGLILLIALRPRRADWTPARLRAAAAGHLAPGPAGAVGDGDLDDPSAWRIERRWP